jgi:hypothetical protein
LSSAKEQQRTLLELLTLVILTSFFINYLTDIIIDMGAPTGLGGLGICLTGIIVCIFFFLSAFPFMGIMKGEGAKFYSKGRWVTEDPKDLPSLIEEAFQGINLEIHLETKKADENVLECNFRHGYFIRGSLNLRWKRLEPTKHVLSYSIRVHPIVFLHPKTGTVIESMENIIRSFGFGFKVDLVQD